MIIMLHLIVLLLLHLSQPKHFLVRFLLTSFSKWFEKKLFDKICDLCLELILNLKYHNWPPFAQVETEGETNHLSQPKHFLVGFLLTSDSKNDLKNIIWQRKTDRSQTLFHQCALSLLFIDIINLGKWLGILKNIYKSQPNCWPPFVQIETESATETPGTGVASWFCH